MVQNKKLKVYRQPNMIRHAKNTLCLDIWKDIQKDLRIYCKINKRTTDIQPVKLIEIRNENRLKKGTNYEMKG